MTFVSFIYFFWLSHVAREISVPQPGIESTPPVLVFCLSLVGTKHVAIPLMKLINFQNVLERG